MKKAFGVFVAVVLMPLAPANAWVGGPFSKNQFSASGDDGVYEAIATIRNGIGMYRFGVRNETAPVSLAAAAGGSAATNNQTTTNMEFNAGLSGGTSTSIWFYRGISYIGSCAGMVNSSLNVVAVVGNAQSDGALNTIPLQVITISGDGVVILGGPSRFTNPTGDAISYANSSFKAKIVSKGPAMLFKGTGTVAFTNAEESETITRETDVTTTTVDVNGNTTTTTTSSVSVDQEETTGNPVGTHYRKFRVTGSKVASTITIP